MRCYARISGLNFFCWMLIPRPAFREYLCNTDTVQNASKCAPLDIVLVRQVASSSGKGLHFASSHRPGFRKHHGRNHVHVRAKEQFLMEKTHWWCLMLRLVVKRNVSRFATCTGLTMDGKTNQGIQNTRHRCDAHPHSKRACNQRK